MTARTEIIEALVAQFQAGFVADGEIYSTRLYKLPDERLPAVFISILSDTVDYSKSSVSVGSVKQMRVLEVQVLVKAIGTDGAALSQTLDETATQVEIAVYDDKSLGIKVRDIAYLGTDFDYNEDSSSPRGTATVTFSIMYQVQESDPFTIV